MKATLILVLAISLQGCMAMSNTYRNPQTGQKFTCRAVGAGVIGVAVSGIEQAACIDRAKTAGFTDAL